MDNHFEKYADLIWFPRLNTTGIDGAVPFLQGLLIDMALDDVYDADKLVQAVHYYWDALYEGSIEAGVNLMRILMKTQLNARKAGNEGLPDKGRDVSEELALVEHPILPYYEALTCIFTDGQKDDGWAKMDELASAGNQFAATLCAYAEICQEGNDAPED